MINITRNKQKYAILLRNKTEQLETHLFRQSKAILRKIFYETAAMIEYGDYLNVVPVVINRYNKQFKELLLKNYRFIGNAGFKMVSDRLQEVRPKKIDNYYFKDAFNGFWYNFNLWSAGQSSSKVTKINDTTKNILRGIIDKGIKEGKSYIDIAKDIRSIEDLTNKNRSKMIAITETHSAFNKSIFESIENENVKMATKEWMNAGDERVRDYPFDHVKANGETVDMDEYFTMTGENLLYPGDPVNGSPGNIIRCRCVSLFNTDVIEITPID